MQKKNKKTEGLGSSPIEGMMICMSEQKQKEWEELPDNYKNLIREHLSEIADRMESKVAIEMLCHVINDFAKRIEKLENDHKH